MKPSPSRWSPEGSAKWASRLHLISICGSVAFWAYLGRHLWFFGDEWDFLVNRGLSYPPGSPRSIWYPHFGHWSVLPILVWRALYSFFHLGTYWPYFAVLLLVEAAVMHLLWRVCTRSGLSPWVSTAAVALVGFAGPGAEDLGWAFQIGFLGSIAFGLVALLLADKPGLGPQGHLAVALFLLASLMCSTVGDAMFVAVAVVLLARRPRNEALAALGIPFACYALWWLTLGHRGLGGSGIIWASFTALPGYVWTGLSTGLGRALNLEAAGAPVLLGLGAWILANVRALFGARPMVFALGAGAIAFYVLVGLGRDTAGDQGSTAPRYIYVAVALLAPAIAAALSTLDARAARASAVVLLSATLLGDIGQSQTWAAARTTLVGAVATEIRADAEVLGEGARAVAGPSATPVPYTPELDLTELRGLAAADLLAPARAAAVADARLALQVGISRTRLFAGRFSLGAHPGTRVSVTSAGCTSFVPAVPGATAQLSLDSTSPASARVMASGPLTIKADFLAGRGPRPSQPAQLAATSSPAYLDDSYSRAPLLLRWTAARLDLCGLGAPEGRRP